MQFPVLQDPTGYSTAGFVLLTAQLPRPARRLCVTAGPTGTQCPAVHAVRGAPGRPRQQHVLPAAGQRRSLCDVRQPHRVVVCTCVCARVYARVCVHVYVRVLCLVVGVVVVAAVVFVSCILSHGIFKALGQRTVQVTR